MSVSPQAITETRDRESAELLERACAEIDRAEAGRLRQQVVLANRGLATGIARHFEGRGIEAEDLSQVAMLGLVQAARRYRPDRGPGFTAFAAPTITGELKRYFRDHGWAVRPPGALQELHQAVRDTTARLRQERQRDICDAEDPYDTVVTLISLRAAMEDLDGRERQILRLRFTADMTQQEIGERIGVSQVQVSRILTSICRRLRARIEGEPRPFTR